MVDAATEAQALKLPPHSTEAEQGLLGCVLTDNRCWQRVQRNVRGADFYSRDHAEIWQACAELLGADRPADVVTVFERLQARGLHESTGGLAYLNDLALSVANASAAEAYAGIVTSKAKRRRVMQLGQDLTARARAATDDEAFSALLAWVQDEVAQIAQGRLDAVPQRMAELLPAWIDDLQARANGQVNALPTGLRSLDRKLYGGMRRGDLMVLGSRPSMGKSAFTLGVMRSVAAAAPVLVCSMEDSTGMLISRQVASTTRTPFEHVRLPQRAPDSLWHAVSEACELLGGLPLWLDDRAGLSLADVANKVAYVKAKAGDCALVVVDYLQLMEDAGQNRADELANVVRGLKTMAKRMNCAVLLLSQLNRKADETNAPPRLDHLAESGAIEQAADIIALLWRESRRNPKPDNMNVAQVELVKHKNGQTCTVQLYFDGATQRFDDLHDGGDHGGD